MNTLKAEMRSMETKARRLRKEGYITGNLFGRELKSSIPVKIKRKEAERSMKGCMPGTQMLLEVEQKTYDVLVKEMHYDAIKRQMLEVDFQVLVQNEKVHSVAEVVLTNVDKVTEGVVEHLTKEVSYRAYPRDLVDKIVIDASTLRLGDSLKVSDLELAKNEKVEILTNLDALVVNVIIGRAGVSAEETEEVAK